MNLPCPINAPCTDDSNPFQNLSTEAPDVNHFYSYGSASGSVLPGRSTGPGSAGPPPGGNWSAGCITANGPVTCVATTQAEAGLCVDRLAQECQPTPNNPNQGTPPTSPTGAPLFGNTLQQCTAFCPDGTPFVFVVGPGEFVASTQTMANRQANSYACRQAELLKICFGPLSPAGTCAGSPYSASLDVSGQDLVSATIISGTLPPGIAMSLNGNTISFQGTPTTSGNFTFTVRVVNSIANFMAKTFTISVVSITTATPLPNFIPNSAYSQPLVAAGGIAPFTWTIINGSLPTGLSLSTAGVISGTSSFNGSSSFTVQVQDSSGITCTKAFTLAAVSTLVRVCEYSTMLAAMGGTACPAGPDPAWDGTFSLQSVDGIGHPIYYAIKTTVKGAEMGAEQLATYPNGGFQNFPQTFINLRLSNTNIWVLTIACQTSILWQGSQLQPGSLTDPSGQFLRFAGTSAAPNSVQVEAISKQCCPPNWGSIVWGAPSIITNGAGTAFFDDNGGGTGDVITDTPNAALGVDMAWVKNTGTFHWAGNPTGTCTCNAHCDVFKTATPAALTGGTLAKITVNYLPDAGGFIPTLAHIFGTQTPGVPLHVDLPFSFVNQGPGTVQVIVENQCPIGAPGGPADEPGHQACEMDFAFTNL